MISEYSFVCRLHSRNWMMMYFFFFQFIVFLPLWSIIRFNKSEISAVATKEPTTTSTTTTTPNVALKATVSTGRAIDSGPFPFPLNNLNYNRNRDIVPANHRSDNYNKAQYVYPSPVYTSSGAVARPPAKQCKWCTAFEFGRHSIRRITSCMHT